MSSISVDGSGKRPLTCTTNDDARTYASIASKVEDSATISLNSFEEVSCYLPATAKLQLVRVPHKEGDGHDEMIRLVVPRSSLSLSCRGGEKLMPSVSVSVRKWETDPDFFFSHRDAEVASEVPVAAAVLVKIEVAGGE